MAKYSENDKYNTDQNIKISKCIQIIVNNMKTQDKFREMHSKRIIREMSKKEKL